MDVRTRKLTLLYQISQEADAISIKHLLDKLGDGYAERSVRRWLSEMIEEGLVEKVGAARGVKYRVVHREKRQENSSISCFSAESEKVLKLVRRPIYERVPTAYSDEWLEAYQPNTSFYIPLESRLKLHKAGKRSTNEDPAGTYAHQIFNRLLIDLSYNSSRLEGNTYSLLDTQKLLLEGTGAEGKLHEEKVMILNHKEAIRYLVDNASRTKIDEETICTLHYLLSEGLLENSQAGKIRNHGVRIGGSTYIPFESQNQLQLRLVRLLQKAMLINDPYEQSLFLLVHLSYLQAFADVNKRTARLSANIPLIKSNAVPLSFSDVKREDYNSAVIAVYELQDINPMLDLYLFSYMRTCAMYDSTIKAINYDEIRVRYRQQRRNILRKIILKQLIGHAMNDYIAFQVAKLIKVQDQEEVYKDIIEDVKEMDKARIAGLGITPDELAIWMALRDSSE